MIRYSTSDRITAEQFVDILKRSELAQRRPIDDHECMQGMVEHANLLITAWRGEALVGIARSVTDFSYCCYVADLAVDRAVQRTGIGRRLLALTKEQVGPLCKLLLFSAPAAESYYAHIGFSSLASGWVLE